MKWNLTTLLTIPFLFVFLTAGECRKLINAEEEGTAAGLLPTEPEPMPPCLAKIRGPVLVAPLTMQLFDDSDNCGDREWNFGDGRTSEVEEPIHVYGECGEYVATLKAWFDIEMPDSAQVPVSLECPPEPAEEPADAG